MAERKEKSNHTEAYIVIAVVLAVLAYIFFRLNAGTNASTPVTSSNANPNSAVIPANQYPFVNPLSAGTVNINFDNQPTVDGVNTYIPLFGFLRFGPSYG